MAQYPLSFLISATIVHLLFSYSCVTYLALDYFLFLYSLLIVRKDDPIPSSFYSNLHICNHILHLFFSYSCVSYLALDSLLFILYSLIVRKEGQGRNTNNYCIEWYRKRLHIHRAAILWYSLPVNIILPIQQKAQLSSEQLPRWPWF